MYKKVLGLTLAALVSGSALAAPHKVQAHAQSGFLYCRFDYGWQPTSFLKLNMKDNVITTITGKNQEIRTYKSVRSAKYALDEDQKNGAFTLMVSDKTAAIHVRHTRRATLFTFPKLVFPYQAYWGEITGRLDLNVVDKVFSDKGPRGVCWTKANPPVPAPDTGRGSERSPEPTEKPSGGGGGGGGGGKGGEGESPR